MPKTYSLPTVQCGYCGAEIAAVSAPAAFTPPTAFSDCLRACTACGKGAYSNARTKPTWIFRDPVDGVPAEVRDGFRDAAANALNSRNQKTKLFRLGFQTSEDAVTWCVFRYLADSRQLRAALRNHGNVVAKTATAEPTMLLWGVPVPSSGRGDALRAEVEQSLKSLGETKGSFSEPDVLLDFDGAGVVVIEAKLHSGNDSKARDYSGWMKRGYLKSPAFQDPEKARTSGCYELARNWRIASEVAASRPACLINLGVSQRKLRTDKLDLFETSLSLGSERQFQLLTWSELLEDRSLPTWLTKWLNERAVLRLSGK